MKLKRGEIKSIKSCFSPNNENSPTGKSKRNEIKITIQEKSII